MDTIFLGGGGALAAFLVHVALWRWRVPRQAIATLMRIFVGALVAAICAGWAWVPAFGWGESAYVAAFIVAAALAYIVVYTTIQYDSPTLALVNWVLAGGETGRRAGEIDSFIQAHPFVLSRLAELERARLVVRQDDGLRLVKKSHLLLEIGELYRRLMGRSTRGG